MKLIDFFAWPMSFLILLASSSAIAGKEGGGGIIVAAEFATTARHALEILAMGDPQLDLKRIFAKIKDTKVVPVESICYLDPVLHKQYCEDAHYDAKNNIVLLAYPNWTIFSCKEKLILSTHEMLRVAGLEAEDYSYSGRFISNKVAQCDYTRGDDRQQVACADLTIIIENRIEKLCQNLGHRDPEVRK